jgi:ribosomal protein S12 methylthiotransferase accessory factor
VKTQPQHPIDYRLGLKETSASTGYFAAIPEPTPTFDAGLVYLCENANDSFMHTHLLAALGEMDVPAAAKVLETRWGGNPTVRALLLEAGTVYAHLSEIKTMFKAKDLRTLAKQTPLIFLSSDAQRDQDTHRQWSRLFQDNMTRHRPLPPPSATGVSFPVRGVDGSDELVSEQAHLKAIIDRYLPEMKSRGEPRPPLEETIARAIDGLERLGIFEGAEMRHQSSLSLYALLRKWRFTHRVTSGSLDYTFSSVQTAYGRGLSLEAARASCLMEVAERCSAFASIVGSEIVGTRRPHPIVHGTRSELTQKGHQMLDPNDLGLEVPYQDEPLYWMEGERLSEMGTESIWVPVQCVFLFCNLDERALFSGLGSTGLASGNTLQEARLSALFELLERDGQAVNPFHPARCFRVFSNDEKTNALFEDYRARGIHLQFQDTSPAYGIPSCTCFVTHRDGTVAKGGGANLNGKRAVLSALTETPYPYPVGSPSAPALPDLPWLAFESLPDFSTGLPDLDLLLVEKTLMANGYAPIYVDITRRDLEIPVARALVPGLEIMADFDRYSRISTRLFNNYLNIHSKS